MTKVVVDLEDADLAALRASASHSGLSAEELLRTIAHNHAEDIRRVGPEVVAMIDRQIRRHRHTFDRLAD